MLAMPGGRSVKDAGTMSRSCARDAQRQLGGRDGLDAKPLHNLNPKLMPMKSEPIYGETPFMDIAVSLENSPLDGKCGSHFQLSQFQGFLHFKHRPTSL